MNKLFYQHIHLHLVGFSYCPSNKMRKSGNLLITFQKNKVKEKEKEKKAKSSVGFTLKPDFYWLHQ